MPMNVAPKADQPRVTTGDLPKQEPNLQYRTQGFKPTNTRTPKRTNDRGSRD